MNPAEIAVLVRALATLAATLAPIMDQLLDGAEMTDLEREQSRAKIAALGQRAQSGGATGAE